MFTDITNTYEISTVPYINKYPDTNKLDKQYTQMNIKSKNLFENFIFHIKHASH